MSAYLLYSPCFVFLEISEYVRVLLIDFSKASDVLNHVILLRKTLALGMPTNFNNWLISFFTGRTQVCKHGLSASSCIFITRSIIQGSTIGSSAFVIMEGDLHPK